MSEVVVSTFAFGERANVPAWKILVAGGSALDVVVAGVSVAERDPEVKSVGYGGYPNAEGEVEVDAAVMDGRNLGYGSVVALKNIDVATAVARDVMEKTDHVMLAGEGALSFGRWEGYAEREMLTDRSRKAWEEWKAGRSGKPTDSHDTIGMVAMDKAGDIAAACVRVFPDCGTDETGVGLPRMRVRRLYLVCLSACRPPLDTKWPLSRSTLMEHSGRLLLGIRSPSRQQIRVGIACWQAPVARMIQEKISTQPTGF